MKKFRKKAILILFIFIIAVSTFLFKIQVYAKGTIEKNVLILNPYSSESSIISGYQSRDWTKEIIDSINSQFVDSKKDIVVNVEYMDSNSSFENKYWEQLYDLYKNKYKNKKFDVVITLDDNAFQFLRKYGDSLFPNTPVVFSGVNNFDDSMISEHPLYTGLTKSADVQNTIEIGLKLHPYTKQVFVISDKTAWGKNCKDITRKLALLHKDKVNFVFCDDEDITKVKEKIKELPKDTIIYFDGSLKNDTGEYMTTEYCIDTFFKNINIPIYSRTYIQINKESVGGMITEGSDLGKEIGNLALRILDGENVSNIPVTEDSSHKYEFNYVKLQQFHIDLKSLPKGSIILNKPDASFNISRELIIITTSSILVIVLFVIYLTIFNIYKRRLVEKLLSENESLLKIIINSTPDIICFKDDQGRLLEANDSILDLLNVKDVDYKLKTIEELNSDFCLTLENSCLLNKESLEKSDILRTEETIRSEKNGTNKIYDIIRVPLFNDDGTCKGVVLLGRDITERKQMEDELKEAKEKAEAANMAKTKFLANMSHEIRTPLNAINSLSELLIPLINDEKQKEYAKIINTAGKNLLILINDILDLSKIEADKLEIKYMPVYIKAVFSEIEQIFKQKVIDKKIQFIIDVQEQLPQVLSLDEVRLRQILLNIVGNAVKFTESGYVKVAVKRGDKNKESTDLMDLLISVEDTGIGIPENQHEFIFQSFTQQPGQNTKKFGGTGLGLSISKRLVEMMNGTITLKSSAGKGSIFTIALHDVHICSNETPLDKEKTIFTNEFKFEKAKVLVVDDIELNRYLFKEILENAGLDVITAENGLSAIEIANNEKPDFIIMDSMMPVMDGIKATSAIREIEHLRNTPIIAVSANSMKNDRGRFFEAGINDYITKPININEFLNILKKWLKPLKSGTDIIKDNEISNSKHETFEFMPEIEGVDINAGIERLCGNKKLYLKMLIKFFKDNEKLLLKVRDAIQEKDLETSLGLLHGLKGASGNLSLISIYNEIVELETQIKQRTNENETYTDLFNNLSENFKTVAFKLYEFQRQSSQIIEDKDNSIEDTVNKAEIIECLSQLKEYLGDYDSRAVKYMEEIKEKLSKFLCKEDVIKIEEKITIYEFDTALEYIDAVVTKIL